MPPSTMPIAVNASPRDMTSRRRSEARAPSAMRSASSRALWDTDEAITPYRPIAARTSAMPPKTTRIVTEMRCDAVVRSTCSRMVISTDGVTFASSACTSRARTCAIAAALCDVRM